LRLGTFATPPNPATANDREQNMNDGTLQGNGQMNATGNFWHNCFHEGRIVEDAPREITKAERIANLREGIEMYTRLGKTEAVRVRVENLNKLLASPRT
jgi:hypothetical protein